MESILERRLLSPLAEPNTCPLVDGIHAQDLRQASTIISKFSQLFGRTAESTRCEELIQAKIEQTNGDFLITLSPSDRAHTPFDCQNPSVEMRPLGPLGWKVNIGDGFHQTEVLNRVGARPLKVSERLAYPISPIPSLHGASGFGPIAAALALRNSLGLRPFANSDQEKLCPELVVIRGDERHLISCSIGFWMDGDAMHRDGHYAFARRAFEVQPQYRQQLFVDISSLHDDGGKVPYVKSPSVDLVKTVDVVRHVIRENFSARSSTRKKSTDELR